MTDHVHRKPPGPYLCPTCDVPCVLTLTVDPDAAVLTGDTVLYAGAWTAMLECPECGWIQHGGFRDVEVCVDHGVMLSGTYVPLPSLGEP